jgi:2-oxoisovalerate dehydrogenase E2 component (dihydrolipoyl transacylase)
MDFLLPPVGEGLIEVELVRWLVKPGDNITRGQSLAEVMSDKATMEVPSPFAGQVQELLAEPGLKIKVGGLFLRYSGNGSDPGEVAKPSADHKPAVVTPTPAIPAPPTALAADKPPPAASPSVRQMARKLGIELTRLRGTGPAGRILLEDLTAHLNKITKKATEGSSRVPELPQQVGLPGTRQKMVGLRRKIADHMVASKRTIPHYAYIDECDVTDLVRLRTQLKETFGKAGVKLTYLPFIVKAAARALREVPIVNATFDEANQEIVLHDHYNIGIAVAGPNGLVVPVLHDADQKDIAAISTEIDRLSADVRAGKPKLEDLRGGTFTITSIGSIGGLISTPIINSPEVGILGIGKVVRRPVYDANNQIKPADLLYLSFSFDHRIVDGAIGASFGNAVIRQLQNPATLLLPERYAS